jgi:DNA invertase Pin-like site-specific DNA recombinase
MGGILGYARVSTGDQDVTGQTLRLTQAGAIRLALLQTASGGA